MQLVLLLFITFAPRALIQSASVDIAYIIIEYSFAFCWMVMVAMMDDVMLLYLRSTFCLLAYF